MKVKSESEVAQSCLTLCNPMDCSLPGPSVHGVFQARVLEWGAVAFSSGLEMLSFLLVSWGGESRAEEARLTGQSASGGEAAKHGSPEICKGSLTES